jgi:hypothetical protein
VERGVGALRLVLELRLIRTKKPRA